MTRLPEVSEAMPASNEETWAESALSLMRAERLPCTGLVGAAVGVEHDGAGGVDDEGGAGAGIGSAVGVLQLVGGVGDVDGAEDVIGIRRCGGRPGAGGGGRVDDGGVEEDAALAGVAEVHLRGAGLAGHGRAEQLVFQGRIVQVGLA